MRARERPASADPGDRASYAARSMRALIGLARPRQWVKNLLVFAAPAAAGVLDDPLYIGRTLVVFAAFCLAASGTYCLNDAADAQADRLHPVKRLRPVASGLVSQRRARALGGALIAAGLAVAAATGDWEVPAVIAGYLALTTTYTYWLKHIPVVDIVAVASGFVIRAVAGIVGTDIPVSDWYLIVASFGSLFLVSGKRTTELRLADAHGHRRVLMSYSPSFLSYIRSVATGVTLLAYCLWAFERSELAASPVPWFEISIVPFALILFRYALVNEGADQAPEDIVLGDRQLQVIGAVWALTMVAGVYVAGAPPVGA